MNRLLENLVARLWNKRVAMRNRLAIMSSLVLGLGVSDGQVSRGPLTLAQGKRLEHIAVLGKTGRGKSSFLRHLAVQDIRAGRGFVSVDLHGDMTPFLLRSIAEEEQRRRQDLSDRVIIVDPADSAFSVGLNVLEMSPGLNRFVQVAEFTHILRRRWQLESLGARTEELLRNALHVLADNGLTLLELAPLLTEQSLRVAWLQKTSNQEAQQYFRERYDRASEPMRAVMRDPILNKIGEFTADPHFRHILGQQRSTFSLSEAMDAGRWVLLRLPKGQLGEQAATLGSLFMAKLRNALFARRSRTLFTFFLDEVQNLVAYDSGLDTLLSEARKFGVSISTANQFLDQYPPQMRSAILAVGTHVFFQLSSLDADRIAAALDGGKSLAAILKNLPKRQAVVKSGSSRGQQFEVPEVSEPGVEGDDLYRRSRQRWARRRVDVEREIADRVGNGPKTINEQLDDWE